MQNATTCGYRRHGRTRPATRKPARVGPLLTFMVRRGSTVRVRQRASGSRCKLRGFELYSLFRLATKVAPLRTPPRLVGDPLSTEMGIRGGASAGASLD